ncbi:MAG TPA: putative ABC exporter domain-containing protein [Lacunisphaera sp.]|nr:putative ABC exporter domain-containing protein [Lacunisphaera sp.]
MPVLRALVYLRLTTLRNRVASQLRRLRQPKYLFGAIAGAAYFWFFVFRHTAGRGGAAKAFDGAAGAGPVEVIGAVVLTCFIVLIWLMPGDDAGLTFSEAEVAFLFPAPFARRQLIHYKLLDGLITSFMGAVFFLLITGGWNTGGLSVLRRLGAWWSLNANVTLHHTVAALAIARLVRLGLRVTLRRVLIIAGIVLGIAALGVLAHDRDAASLEWLLWPAKVAMRPFFATGAGDYLLALLPAAGLVALQYFIIFRMEVPFEEASIALAQKRGEAIARMRAGKFMSFAGRGRVRRAPFRLGDRLPVEAAFLWKNLMAAPSYCNRKVFLGAAVVIYASLTWLKSRTDFEGPIFAFTVAVISVTLLAYMLLFGPQLARNDLRGDLAHADMLKAYPVPGWRILLGSLLAPTVIMTAISWLFLLAAVLGFVPPGGKIPWLTPQLRITVGIALAVIMPFLCAVQLLVPNAATLLFPAWAQTSRNLSGGMDVLGQRLILFGGQMLCLIVALLPSVLLAGGTIFLTQWLVGLPTAIVLAAVPVLGVFTLQLCLGVWWLGPRFDKLDISAELRP